MQKQVRFSALDGLRGFAAMGVFFYHGADLIGFRVASGYLAVDFFFCLSGFVIAAAYEQRLLAGEKLSSFVAARLTRLYPVYLLGMALGLFYAVMTLSTRGGNVEPVSFATSLALGLVFLPSPPELVQSFSTRTFPFVIQAWSLFYELAANLFYATTVRFLRLACLLLILLLILPFLVYAAFSFGSLDLGAEWVTMPAGFARSFFSFFAGVLVFRLRPNGLVLPAWSAWVCIVVLLAVLYVNPGAAGLRAAYDLMMVILVFPMLTLAASCVSEEPRNQAIFDFAGAASYPLYILHGAFVMSVRFLFGIFGVSAANMSHVFWLAVFALVIAAAAWIDMSYERPAIRWLRSKLPK